MSDELPAATAGSVALDHGAVTLATRVPSATTGSRCRPPPGGWIRISLATSPVLSSWTPDDESECLFS